MADPLLVPGGFTPGTRRFNNVVEITTTVGRGIMNNRGELTPYNAVAQFFDTIEIRTKATPPILLKVRDLDAAGASSPLLEFLKPTIILRGPLGTKVIAPYGEVPSADEGIANAWKVAGVTLAALAGIGVAGFLGGTLRQRVKRRRQEQR